MNDSDETMCDSPERDIYSESGSPSILGGLDIYAKPTLKTEKEDTKSTTSSKDLVRNDPVILKLKREHQDELSGCEEGPTSPEYPPLCSKMKKTRQNIFRSSSLQREDYSESCNSTQDFDSQVVSNDSPIDCEEFEVIERCITEIEEQVTALMILREQGTSVSSTKEFTELKEKMLDARLLLSKLNTLHQKEREDLTSSSQNSDGQRTSKQDLFVLASKQRRLLGLFKRYEDLLGKAKSLKNTLHSKHIKTILPNLQRLTSSKTGSVSSVQEKEQKKKVEHRDFVHTAVQRGLVSLAAIPATVQQGSGHVATTVRQDTLRSAVQQGSGHVATTVRQVTPRTAVQQGSGHVATTVRQDTPRTAVQQGSGHVATTVSQDTPRTAVQQGSGHVATTVSQDTPRTAVQQGPGHVDTTVRQETPRTTVQQGSGHVDTTVRQDTPRTAVQQGSGHVATTVKQDTPRTAVQQGSGHVATTVRQDTPRTAVQQGLVSVIVTPTTVQQGSLLSLLPNYKLAYLVNTTNTMPTASIHGRNANVLVTTGSAKKAGTTIVNLKAKPLQSESGDITKSSYSRPVVTCTSINASCNTTKVVPLTESHHQVPVPVSINDMHPSITTTTPASLQAQSKNVSTLSSTTPQADITTLLRYKVIEPGRDVLSVIIQEKMFTASLKPNGRIQSAGGEIFHTPMAWLKAVTGSKTVLRQNQAYSKILYKGKALSSYCLSNSVLQGKEAINPPSSKQRPPTEMTAGQSNTSSHAYSTLPSTTKESNPVQCSSYISLSNILSRNCTVRVISDDELIPTASILPADFWSTSFDMIDLDPKLFDI